MGIVPKTFLEFCSQIILLLCKAQPYGTSESNLLFFLDFWREKTTKTPSHQVMGPWFYYPSISIPVTKPLSTMRLPACLNPNLSRPMFPTSRPPSKNREIPCLPGAPNTAPLSALRSSRGQITWNWNPETDQHWDFFHGNWPTDQLHQICRSSTGWLVTMKSQKSMTYQQIPACTPMPRHFFGQLLDRLPCQWI